MTEQERSKLYLERLLAHKEHTREGKFYALKRVDLLVISISGAGIYIIFEMIKFFYQEKSSIDLCAIKIAGCSFAISIIVNFFSQWTGYEANKNDSESVELDISKEKGDVIDEFRLRVVEQNVRFYNRFTGGLNIVATILMLLGISILTIFNLFIF